jgi:hypothetical protein
MSHKTTAETDEAIHLFTLESFSEVDPAEVFAVSNAIRRRCCPTSIRLSLDVAESFLLREIRGGVELLLAMHEPVGQPETKTTGVLRRIILEVGMDFTVVAENDGAEPMRLKMEVWGHLVPFGATER